MAHVANSGSFKAKDWTGYQFENGVVLKDTGRRSKRGMKIWLCQCNCGNTFEIDSDRIHRVRSCGCLAKVRYRVDDFELLDGEEWKSIPGFDGYEISNMGRIISKNYLGHGVARLLTPMNDSNGYYRIGLRTDGKRKSLKVHRLVAEAFVDNPEQLDEVIHVDGNKKNNCAENLAWKSLKEIINDDFSSGKRVQHSGIQEINARGQFCAKDRRGERYWNYVLIEDTGKKAKDSSHIWKAACDCGKEFEIPATQVGKKKSCGCMAHRNGGTKEAERLLGYTVRGFEVIRDTGERDNEGYAIWEAKCLECGAVKKYPSYYLKRRCVSCECEGWKEKYKEKTGRRALPDYQSHVSILYKGYKKGAEERNLEFCLTKVEFREIIEQDCAYCGAKPRLRHTNKMCSGEYRANGIDRVDSSLGYIISNCVPCCSECNYMKNTMEKDKFLEHVRDIYMHIFGGDDGKCQE